jgi:exopolysaccharide biosynthesis polyprenyl glycosylphosphotransferase
VQGVLSEALFKMRSLSPSVTQTRVAGIRVDRVDTAGLLATLEELIHDGRTHHLCYVNADGVNRSVLDRRYRQILQEADLVYADGMGVVWASRLFGEPLPERVTLGDFLPTLCALCVEKGYRLFLLGGASGIARRAAERLTGRFPGLDIVGAEDGYFSPAQEPALIERINRARPHLLLVGMGVPKQEKWIWQHRQELRVPVCWGVGALLDYSAGKTPRAPVWLRRVGGEWLFRLLVEPKRLWRRYLLGNAFFVLRTCALLLTDAGLVTLAWLGAYGICRRLGQPLGVHLNPLDPYLQGALLITGIWLVTCAGFGLYRRSATMSALAELAQVIRATGVGVLCTMAVAFLFREASFGRPVVLLAGALAFLALTTSRLTARAIERRLARRGIGLRRALIIGTGTLAKRLKQEIELWPVGYEVVGFVADGEPLNGPEHDGSGTGGDGAIGSVRELGHLIPSHHIQEVFLASQNLKLRQELNLLAEQEHWPVNFHVVSEELAPFAKRVRLDQVVELPLLDLPAGEAGRWYEWSKSAFDVAAAGLGLLACLPLLGLIALIVKLESPGPALFVQERIGQGGRRFWMYKFRTMVADAPAYSIAPNDLADPRVTRFGRFLRRWSLDELPQLVNVLRGDMSLVGPRPEMGFLVEQYEPWQKRRLMVTPGLTGLWQILGRKELPLQRHLEYDLYYVRHRGWLLDTAILLRTLPAVLWRRGAF